MKNPKTPLGLATLFACLLFPSGTLAADPPTPGMLSKSAHTRIGNALSMTEAWMRERVYRSSAERVVRGALEEAMKREDNVSIYRIYVFRMAGGTGWIYQVTAANDRCSGKNLDEALAGMVRIYQQGILEDYGKPNGYVPVPGEAIYMIVENKGVPGWDYRFVTAKYLEDRARALGLMDF